MRGRSLYRRPAVAVSPRFSHPVALSEDNGIGDAVLRLAPDLPSATMTLNTMPADSVAVSPRSPIGYNSARRVDYLAPLRLAPDLPSATIVDGKLLRLAPHLPSAGSASSVAVSPRSPIGYNAEPGHTGRVAVISHGRPLPGGFAVSPRSPIGYNFLTTRRRWHD